MVGARADRSHEIEGGMGMPIRFRVRALRALMVAGVALTVAGCAMLRPPPPPALAPLDTADSGAARTYLSLADLREDKSDWAGAQSVVDKGLAQRPGNRALLLRRAQILLHRADGEDAPALRDEARAILAQFTEASDAETRASLAWLDFADGHRDDALAAAHAAADADPASSRMQRILAYLLLRNGDYQGANKAAERAVELAPRSRASLRLRARTRVAIADVGGGEADAREVLRAHRDDPEASAILADALLRQANDEAARRVLAGVPRGHRNARVVVPLARLELGAGHAEVGRALLEEAVLDHPNDAQVHQALVALDIRDGRADDSSKRLEAALAARPDSAALQRLRAQALGAGHRDEEAAAGFARALELDPNDISTYRALTEWLRTRTKSEETERRAAELGLGAGPTLFTIGLLRAGHGDRNGARSYFQRALEADSNLAVARAALAASLAESGEQLDVALTLAREARALRPRDPEIADTLGLVHLRRGQASAALEVLGEAAGTYPVDSPGYADVLYHTAMAFEAALDHKSAQRTLEVALAVLGDRKPQPAWAAKSRSALERPRPTPVAPPAPAAAPTETASPPP
jgi:tetratricopeptide (TPR) repeat protein